MNLSTPQYVLPDYVCPFAVRVPHGLKLSGFSREYGYPRYCHSPRGTAYFRGSARAVDLPAALNAYALQRRIPYLRGGVTPPSPRRSVRQ